MELPLPLEEANRPVPPGVGRHGNTGPDTTRVTLGGTDLDELATRLLALAVQLSVVAPDKLGVRLRQHLDALTSYDGLTHQQSGHKAG
ncbi:hypothetical protein [Streptomyces sp. NPDC048002]|uniref:hypothetical protein n=1 Tax=Streptomyces sp. NPDC048002 TaxID=3154344 RepID=UPI0033F83377